MLALLSDLVCFSVAATPSSWIKVFNEDPATLIDLFLFTNVAACFLEPWAIKNFGLRVPIICAAALMAVGCFLRSGVPFVGETLPSYLIVVIGTMFVAVAQPFFQCTPPLLSATWFAPNERALATAVAINFNQVGIATAFLLGGALGGDEGGLKYYFGLVSVAALVTAVGAAAFFQERPPTPPSASELEKEAALDSGELKEPEFPEQALALLRTPGFLPPLCAFVVSIAVTNVVGAFMEQKLAGAGITNQDVIDYAGAGFEMMIVIGGVVLGRVVDENKEYKTVTLACLAATLLAAFILGCSSTPRIAVLAALLAVGALMGPVQPINAELAVEVTYPADENAIEAVQQLCGNLFSALLVPLCEMASKSVFDLPAVGGVEGNQVKGDTVLLLGIIVAAGAFFSSFNAPLRRTNIDSEMCLIDDLTAPPEEEKQAAVAAADEGGASKAR